MPAYGRLRVKLQAVYRPIDLSALGAAPLAVDLGANRERPPIGQAGHFIHVLKSWNGRRAYRRQGYHLGTDTLPLILPETLKSILRQCSIPRRVLDISVSQVRLQCARIMAVICQFVATAMAKHVSMSLDPQFRKPGRPFDHAREARRGEWRAALRHEHEGRFDTLTLMTAQRPQLVAC
jgi:hypothetical protein